MTKTKFHADILKQGGENDYILRAIASHNEGKVIISIPDLISYGIMKTAIYPLVPVSIDRDDDSNNVVVVTDNGKTTLIITEIEVYELAEADQDDLKEINI